MENNKLSSLSRDSCYCGNNESLLYPIKCRADKEVSKLGDNGRNSYQEKDHSDLEYIPGNLTSFKTQHYSRDYLLEDKYNVDKNITPDSLLSKNKLGDHECILKECEQLPIKFIPSLPQTTPIKTKKLSPKPLEADLSNILCKTYANEDYLDIRDKSNMFGSYGITEKPNERYPSPVAPAYANFELAKQMHSNNLDHQPLPDCVADVAFRKLQITGEHPGLALEIEPIATGVGIKTHNAGPTHCTKMKVYRPKTSGVLPKELNNNFRSFSATPIDKKMGAMDLAICWDYKPSFEPPRPAHIDGSNGSAGPAVFTYVNTPRDDAVVNIGKSSGIFANTIEESDFFNKDILRQKADFAGKHNCTNGCLAETVCPTFTKTRSASRNNAVCRKFPETHLFKQFKSSPDIFADQEYKTLRAKYLGSEWECPETEIADTGCKRFGFKSKARSRLCHKIAPETNCCLSACQHNTISSKQVFRAGMPRTDAAGNYKSSDSGCSIDSNHSQRVLVVPRPRNPHKKKSYDINTLVPPFQSYAGGAGEGGYPEHWRLSSIYQHAFKPLKYRRKPMLQTVYK